MEYSYFFLFLPNTLMDFEHFILNFRALRSNHEPNLDPPVERVLNVFDFCRTLISMLLSSYFSL